MPKGDEEGKGSELSILTPVNAAAAVTLFCFWTTHEEVEDPRFDTSHKLSQMCR